MVVMEVMRMDIVVTTPKSEIDNSREEGEAVEAEGGYWFRTFRFRPKVEIGDRMFFVDDGLIRGYGVIFNVVQMTDGLKDGLKCETTGRFWGAEGDWIVAYNKWHWLKKPVPFKGFQGIRYLCRLPDLKEKLLVEEG
jgi:hypothetical protein